MPDEHEEIGIFALGIRVFKTADGRLEYQTQSTNQGAPVEVVIMQLRAFLNKLEKDYFDEFEHSAK